MEVRAGIFVLNRSLLIVYFGYQNLVSAISQSHFSNVIYYPGEFGDVYKGILKTEDRGDIEVAVKTLKVELSCIFHP